MRTVDVVVIGAGPAGMSCAVEASAAGLSVLVLDENPAPGGQIWRGIETASERRGRILGPDYGAGRTVAQAFRASKAEYLPSALVWNISTEKVVEYSHGGASHQVQAGAVVSATGAFERPNPVPGWTLPGVTTVGALQILLKSAGLVEEDAVLVGSGPLLWLMAAQLVDAGVPPKAVVETTPKGRVLAALRHLPRALRARDYLWKGLALMRKVKAAGVPVHSHATGIRIEGEGRAEAVSFTANGRPVRIESGHIALHHGVVPNQQVTRLMRAEHVWDASQMCFRPVLSETGETSVAGLFVAGDGTGIGGAKAAALQGRLLGLRLAARAGRSVAPERIDRLSAGLAREGSVRPFLEALYAPPAWINVPEDATIVCRCEEITAGQVRAAVDLGAPGPNQVKSYLRSGMGPCQGRVCGLLVSQIIAAKRGLPPQKDDYYRIRPPMKPLPLTELAAYRPEGAK